jgi:hypothetical protein
MASAATSLRSSASTQFRIKRKPVPRFGDERPLRQCSMPLPSMQSETKRVERHRSLDPQPPPDRTSQTDFRAELDRLFDELFEQCRAGSTIPTVRAPSATSTHRRSRSDLPESFSSSIQRVQTLRQSRILVDSDTVNITPCASQPDETMQSSAKANPFFGSARGSRSSGRPRTAPAHATMAAGCPRDIADETGRSNVSQALRSS